MKLIIGGAFQGKLAYASAAAEIAPEEFADGAVCGFEVLDTCRGMNHFHEYVRRCLQEGRELTGYLAEGRSVEELPERIVQKNPEVVLVANELGCGIVPMDPFERQFREAFGRLCCRLAQEAKEVHRVICGLGTVIRRG